MTVYPIVEGHGEVAAAPILLRRLLSAADCHRIRVGSPIRRTQAQIRSQEGIQKGVRLALLQPECAAVIVLFDGDVDGDCPKELAAKVQGWARSVAGATPCDVVVAYREYETWLVAALESLRGKHGIADSAVTPENPESKRDAKSVLERFMPARRAYSPTIDQPGLSAVFDLAQAHRRSRSFRKLTKAVGQLVGKLDLPPPTWPPADWHA